MTTTVVEAGITALELHAQRDALKNALRRYEVIQTNCAHCKHFEMGTCDLHGNVPIDFQKSVDQCDDWRYDGVPF